MNHFLHGVVRAFAESFTLPEPILEVGAYQVAGQETLGNLRGLFPGRDYTGLDMRPGPGVDCVANVEKLPQPDGSVGTVIACNTFEHVRRFWRGFDEIHRVLRPDGVFLVSCPFYFRIHQYPQDYWRFTPAALETLLEEYPSKILGWHGPKQRPAHVWALACREDHRTDRREPVSAAIGSCSKITPANRIPHGHGDCVINWLAYAVARAPSRRIWIAIAGRRYA